ncbi:LPS export ABC transporter periplasmic protein LptC [Candidatus Pelagibacter sp.]|nr:LPS export ABC transporter periplasmic protein LptC [Candidatus Pelagibacter sp.]
MYKKILIQFLLLITIFIIIFSTFFLYFNKKKNLKTSNLPIIKEKESLIDDETGTLIKDINYTFSDLSGNRYELFSDVGKVDINHPEKIFMTNVIATIYLVDSSPIKITSKYANYNKINHETSFFENVKVTHLIHKATSENLDISFNDNLASMYNNIVYNKPGTNLKADRLEIDLITKNSKIFMDNKTEKIKIIDKK